ncbi:MAG: DUF4396 domain-containing protein, partial [Tannerellaceae bacterium]
MNEYFSIFAACWIISSILCAIIVFLHIKNGHPQGMKIMEAVWPLTALWSGVIGLIAYFKLGNKPMNMKGMDISAHHDDMKMGDMKMDMSMDMKAMPAKPFWEKVALSTLHCGAGCTLADLIGEWLVFF